MEVWAVDNTLLGSRCASCQRKHRRQPTGYVDWHMWAECMSKTCHQVRCPKCGYFVWVRKSKELQNG